MYCTCTLCSYITVQYKQQWACICDTFLTWRQMIRRQRDNAKKRQRNLLSRVNFYRESCWRVPSSEFINSFFKHSNIFNSFLTLGKVHKLTRVLNLNVHYLMRCKQRESWTHIISAGVDMIRNEYVRRPPTAGILRHFFWFLRFLTGV